MSIKRIVLAVLLVAAAFTAYRYFNEDLSDFEQDRLSTDARFLDLELGRMRYQVSGPADAPVVVLVHSFNGFIETWDPNLQSLLDQGFRVVAYDLWGRGLSDRPREDLSLDVFRYQLTALLDQLQVQRATLIGSSFGSVIATDFALQFPDRVDALVMLGPAGWPQAGFDNTAIVDIPLLGDLIFHYRGIALTRSAVDAYFLEPSGHEWVLDLWDRYANYPGFTRSALSTLRHAPVRDYTAGWKALAQSSVPTLVLWGVDDVSFPYAHAQTLRSYAPDASVIGVADAAHWVNIERSERVNQLLSEFLVNLDRSAGTDGATEEGPEQRAVP